VNYDVIVVGAGAAGLVCASLLAKSGKRVAVVEKHRYLGGRAMERRFRGHQLGLGSHLVEDPGDSLQRACEWVGAPFAYSERSDAMPFWDGDRWRPIQEYYGGGAKQGLKRCIEALTETPYEELDRWDHASLREWMARHTSEEGVFQVWEAISVLEQITFKPYEHSASENLYTRKLHYERKRTAGYSVWPMGGWERLWQDLAAAFERLGGTSRWRRPRWSSTPRCGTSRGCSTTARCRGTSSRACGCSATAATRRAGSASGSPPRSR
jgi:phytoene dehydrogenase-like protein